MKVLGEMLRGAGVGMIQDFGGYRLPVTDLHPPVTSYHRLPARPISAGYRLPVVTKKSTFVW